MSYTKTRVVARENIETWAADSPKLYQFRRALEEMQKISDESLMDERGYQWCAGVHGGFGGQPFCEHGTLDFVTWHRPYLLDFETKMRDQIRIFAGQEAAEEWRLPYWNWASRHVSGLPRAFTVATYKDGDETKPNPLRSMPYNLDLPPGPPVGNATTWPTETFRQPRSLADLKRLRDQVLTALDKTQFGSITGFSRSIEQPHNGLHVWAMGYMVTLRSSFDPIFWCHHANVDRQWWIWQQKHGNGSIPEAQQEFTCRPFKFIDNTAKAFFDTDALGYTYTDSTTTITHEEATAGVQALGKLSKKQAALKDFIEVKLDGLSRDPDRAHLQVHGLHHTEETLQIRVFVGRTSANADTPLTTRSGYAGTLTILGHGYCPGAEGHCDFRIEPRFSGDVRAPHHLAPFDTSIDIKDGLSRLFAARKKKKIKAGGTGTIRICFVVVGPDGKYRPTSEIKFDRLSLVAD